MANKMKSQSTQTIEVRLLCARQAAVYLNVPIHTLYKLTSQRRIPFLKVTSRLRFDRGLLDQWIKEHTKMPIKINT